MSRKTPHPKPQRDYPQILRSPFRQRPRFDVARRPVMRFTPYAWAKLEYVRDLGPTEIGGFGQTMPDDPLRVMDLHLVQQTASALSVRFDDTAVADYFDRQVDRGLAPEQFARIWIHTHPGHSARPSALDEQTFARVFGVSDWAVMFIFARGGRSQAWLRYSAGPGLVTRIGVAIDFAGSFAASDQLAWRQEYNEQVEHCPYDLWERRPDEGPALDAPWPEETLDLPF